MTDFWRPQTNGFIQCLEKNKVLVTQSCLTLCDPMYYSLPGKSGFPTWQADSLPSENVFQEHFLMVLVNLFLLPPHLQDKRIFIHRPVEID